MTYELSFLYIIIIVAYQLVNMYTIDHKLITMYEK